MEMFSLDTTAKLLGKTTQTVRNMVKRGELEAVYPKQGKNGRPAMMITCSSYADMLIRANAEKGESENEIENR